jgi:2TM domain-containing protein
MDKLLQDQGFKFHLAAYLIVNAILAIVNYMHPNHIWFFWPLLGWGIGLAAHGFSVWRRPTVPPRRRPS